MKLLITFALSATLASAGFAAPSIGGVSVQTVSASFSSIDNDATGLMSTAEQNVASNAGSVSILGTSNQFATFTSNSVVKNNAFGLQSVAHQNISSNVGPVSILGVSNQITSLVGSMVANSATGISTKAVQNLASNNGCLTC